MAQISTRHHRCWECPPNQGLCLPCSRAECRSDSLVAVFIRHAFVCSVLPIYLPCCAQFGNVRYSRGVRQRLATAAWEADWLGKHNIMIGDHQNFSGGPSYGELMASSVFCLVVIGEWVRHQYYVSTVSLSRCSLSSCQPTGDGWTSRYGDAVSHGCIPVCIMDNVVTMFGTIIEEHDIAGWLAVRWRREF